MNIISFTILRLALGVSMFGHGLVRLPKLPAFSDWMVGNFEKSMLPKALVLPFSYVLPILELLTGFLLLIGLFTRPASVMGAFVILTLIFGSTMIEQWEAIPSQLIHIIFFAALLQFMNSNTLSLDHLFKK